MRILFALILVLPLTGFFTSCTTIEKTSISTKPVITKESIEALSRMKRPRDNSTIRNVRTTAYSHMENEPGAPGKKNAINTDLRYGAIRSAAADWSRYPLGTQFKIAGYPHLYEIDDFGSALVGTGTIDLYYPTLKLMNQWGTRHVDIKIVKWGSFERSSQILSKRCKHAHCRAMYNDLQPKVRKKRG